MKRGQKTLIVLAFFAAFFLADWTEAHAVFSLQVSPRRGGQQIHFENSQPGKLLRNEEVTLTVTTDRASQYRIYQTVYQPLTNEFGNTIPQGAFIVFSPSNPLGTLRTQLETPVTMGQYPVYTSNAAGDIDEFVLVYNVRVPDDQPGGVYRTQITFTAELVNAQGGVSPSIVTMEVRVEITPTFQMKISSSKGGRELDLGRITKDRPAAAENILLEVGSNIGSTYRIVQQMTEPLISQDGAVLDESDFSFTVASKTQGAAAAAGSSPVSSTPLVVYTSNDNGAGDVIQVQFSLKPEAEQKAGIYRGNLTFKVDSGSTFAPQQIFNVPVQVEIEPIFYLDVDIEKGGDLHFGVYKTGDEVQEKRVRLTVHSNLRQPYQVSQIVPTKLTSQEGAVIPADYFVFFGAEAQTGTLSVMSPSPVAQGESPVFISNNKGTPESFVLDYTLKVPKEARAGSYNTQVRYSITTL